jgi:hypothetical protein
MSIVSLSLTSVSRRENWDKILSGGDTPALRVALRCGKLARSVPDKVCGAWTEHHQDAPGHSAWGGSSLPFVAENGLALRE